LLQGSKHENTQVHLYIYINIHMTLTISRDFGLSFNLLYDKYLIYLHTQAIINIYITQDCHRHKLATNLLKIEMVCNQGHQAIQTNIFHANMRSSPKIHNYANKSGINIHNHNTDHSTIYIYIYLSSIHRKVNTLLFYNFGAAGNY